MFGLSQKPTEQANNSLQYIFFHEDMPSKSLDEGKVGRKGLSLFKLRDMDVPIPAFFVVSPAAYRDLLFKAFDNKIVALLENEQYPEPAALADLIAKSSFDIAFQEELIKNYSRLSGFSDAWVSVRSSVVFPGRPDVSFSGIFATELNVRGHEDLMNSIKEIYTSIFDDKVVYYARTNGIKLSELSMSVVVQKMVQAEVSGVAFTVDPITMDNQKMSIEAVFGLGDVVANGEITPDQYILNKKDLSFVEKHIAPQEWMKIRKLTNKRDGKHFGSVERIQISSSWSHQQKLEDRFAQDVAKVALIIEDRAGAPQDIEWVWESGNVWILQSKNIEHHAKQMPTQEIEKATSDSLVDLAVNIVRTTKIENKAVDDAMKLVQREAYTPVEPTPQAKDTMIGRDLASTLEEYNKFVVEEKSEVQSSEMDRQQPVGVPTSEILEQNIAAVIQPAPVQAQNTIMSTLDAELKKLSSMVEKARKAELADVSTTERQQEIVEQYQEQKEQDLGIVGQKQAQTELVTSGIGGSFGVAAGEVRFMKGHSEMRGVVTKKTILVLGEYSLDMQPYIYQAGGVISETGGLSSDLAIECREVGIPAVMGVAGATTLLKEGEMIEIDGNFGSVYRFVPVSEAASVEQPVNVHENEKVPVVEAEPVPTEKLPAESSSFIVPKLDATNIVTKQVEIPQQKIFTATKVFVNETQNLDSVANYCEGVFFIDLDALVLEKNVHPLAASADGKFVELSKEISHYVDDIAAKMGSAEVVVSLGSATIGDFRALPRGKKYEDSVLADGVYGVTRYLKNPELLKKMISIVKRIRNVHHNRNVSLAVHGPLNGLLMSDMKKEITSSGLRRTSTFNIYAILENPSELILAQDILNAEIDGVIVNTPVLARTVAGVDRNDASAKYDLGTGNMLKMVSTAIESASGLKKKVVVICQSNRALVKHCVNKGVYGISVEAGVLDDMKHLVSEEELKLVLGR